MLLVSVDNRIVGGLFIVFVVGWILFKIIDSISNSSSSVPDYRPTCARCGDLLPSGETKCISCGHEPKP
jgi:hypothetical protein